MLGLNAAIFLVELLGAAALLSRFMRIPVVAAVPLYVSAIVVILYAADFARGMRAASYLIHAISLAAGLAVLVQNFMRSTNTTERGVSGHEAFAAAAGLLLAYCLDAMFWRWDEFTHWGSVIKLIVDKHTFHVFPSPLMFQDYPPASALFAYHFQVFSGFSEPSAAYVTSLLLICFIAPVLYPLFRSSLVLGALVSWFVFLAILLFGHGWDSVNIDHVMAVAFAATIAAYFQLGPSIRSLLICIPMLMALTLMKQAGYYLALLAAGTCAVDAAYCLWRDGRSRSTLRSWIEIIGGAGASFLAIAATHASWQLFVSSNGLEISIGSLTLGPQLERVASCCASERETSVAAGYFSTFFGAPAGLSGPASLGAYALSALAHFARRPILPSIDGPVFSVAASIYLLWVGATFALQPRGQGVRHAVLATLMFGGMLLFSLSILLAYLYLFTDYEAQNLASFNRYHFTYILAMMLVALFSIGTGLSALNAAAKGALEAVLAIGAVLTLPLYKQTAYRFAYSANLVAETRKPLRTLAHSVDLVVPKTGTVYIAWLHDVGFEFQVLRQELMPRLSNHACFSFAPSAPQPLIQTCIKSTAELSRDLSAYDFLLVGKGTDVLRRDYPELVDDSTKDSDHLFRIDRRGSLVRLVPVPLQQGS